MKSNGTKWVNNKDGSDPEMYGPLPRKIKDFGKRYRVYIRL
jgi:hypothetical protein